MVSSPCEVSAPPWEENMQMGGNSLVRLTTCHLRLLPYPSLVVWPTFLAMFGWLVCSPYNLTGMGLVGCAGPSVQLKHNATLGIPSTGSSWTRIAHQPMIKVGYPCSINPFLSDGRVSPEPSATRVPSQKAVLISPVLHGSGCLKFFYSPMGSVVGKSPSI